MDRLRETAEKQHLPNEFFAYHGNLAKSERELVESRLRDDSRPTTAVATSTLELGTDIGDVIHTGIRSRTDRRYWRARLKNQLLVASHLLRIVDARRPKP
jgi:ATP-dependent helicase YprA (DUF1998 family)